MLRGVVDIFEKEGYRVLSVAEAAPSLVLGEGVIGKHRPSTELAADIAKGFKVVAQMGELDIGQATAVCDGLVLAVEAAEGTDAMLKRIGDLPERLRGKPGKPRGVLVKAPKPIQDRKTDLPVIGIETVNNVVAAGLSGIAVEAEARLLSIAPMLFALRMRRGLFITGIVPEKA